MTPRLHWELLRFPDPQPLIEQASQFYFFEDEIPMLLYLLKRAHPFKLYNPYHATRNLA